MKIYYVAENRGPQWFYSYGILENGFCFGQHLCSHPSYAPSDLLLRRQNRMDALKEVFGVVPTDENQELIVINVAADKPKWWDGMAALQDGLKASYDRYAELTEEKKSA